MKMKVERFDQLKVFYDKISSYLVESEDINSLFFGTLLALVKKEPKDKPFMCVVKSESQILLSALFFRMNLILSHGDEMAIPFVVEELIKGNFQIPGVIGPLTLAETFKDHWLKKTKCTFRLGMRQKIYKLTRVNPAEKVAGYMRNIEEKDVPLVSEWAQAFHKDAKLPEAPNTLEVEVKNAEQRVKDQKTFFWIVDGVPVCMAALARPTPNGITVNAVFTPKEHRCKGYARALVTKVSQLSLDQGKKFCVLYTDVGNPTSNSIYQKVGYEEVSESINYRFDYV